MHTVPSSSDVIMVNCLRILLFFSSHIILPAERLFFTIQFQCVRTSTAGIYSTTTLIQIVPRHFLRSKCQENTITTQPLVSLTPDGATKHSLHSDFIGEMSRLFHDDQCTQSPYDWLTFSARAYIDFIYDPHSPTPTPVRI